MLTVLEEVDINWQFSQVELDCFRELWADDVKLEDIALELKREPLEVVLLIIDQAEKRKIKKRKHGIFEQ